MNFTVSSSTLNSRLQTLSKVLNPKNSLPILECFLFEVKGNMHFKNCDPTQRMIYPYRKNKTRAFLKKMDQIAEDKHQCYIKNNVTYLTSVDIQPMHYAVSEKHGKDFIEQFKLQKSKI